MDMQLRHHIAQIADIELFHPGNARIKPDSFTISAINCA